MQSCRYVTANLRAFHSSIVHLYLLKLNNCYYYNYNYPFQGFSGKNSKITKTVIRHVVQSGLGKNYKVDCFIAIYKYEVVKINI